MAPPRRKDGTDLGHPPPHERPILSTYCVPLHRKRTNTNQVMQTLLETSPSHATTEQFYDEVIEEFSALNKLRNGYLHGLWWTHESGKTYFEEAASESFAFLTSREVRADELEAVIKRMSELTRKIVRKLAELNQPIIEQRA